VADSARDALAEHSELVGRVEALLPQVDELALLLIEVYGAGGRIYTFGNGGSAGDAQHFAAELVGRFERERRAAAAIALTTDTSILTAIGNDYAFDRVFARQIEALGRAGDVFVAISTSGNSKNILRAIAAAKDKGVRVIGFTGKSGGAMAPECDLCFRVPSDET